MQNGTRVALNRGDRFTTVYVNELVYSVIANTDSLYDLLMQHLIKENDTK